MALAMEGLEIYYLGIARATEKIIDVITFARQEVLYTFQPHLFYSKFHIVR